MKKLAIAFTGPSNSGKTTLIEKISTALQGKMKIAIIKHDPKDKAIFDKEGKDSHKFFKTGADVAVLSPKRSTIFKHSSSEINEVIKCFDDFELLMVEGLKTLPLPRIAIFREKIDESYLPYVIAVAVDDSISKDKLAKINKDILDLNNTQEIINYILKNAKDLNENNI